MTGGKGGIYTATYKGKTWSGKEKRNLIEGLPKHTLHGKTNILYGGSIKSRGHGSPKRKPKLKKPYQESPYT